MSETFTGESFPTFYEKSVCTYLSLPPGFIQMENWREIITQIAEQLPRHTGVPSSWVVGAVRRTGLRTNSGLTEMVELYWIERTQEPVKR